MFLEEGNRLPTTEKPVAYRQIITEAVCGKGKKFSQLTHSIQPPDNIHTILGAWVINHSYDCHRVGESVEITGSYDINLWYSTKGNTKTDVVKDTARYTEQVPLGYYDHHTRESTVRVQAIVTQAPNCVQATIHDQPHEVQVRVEKEFIVEMVGETKICIAVYPLEYAEWDEKDALDGSEGNPPPPVFEELDPELVIDDLDG
jgi:spore coat protein E